LDTLDELSELQPDDPEPLSPSFLDVTLECCEHFLLSALSLSLSDAPTTTPLFGIPCGISQLKKEIC
jgi:hypothetical protein